MLKVLVTGTALALLGAGAPPAPVPAQIAIAPATPSASSPRSTLPATSPTSTASQLAEGPPAQAPSGSRTATITWAQGALLIRSNGAPLNEVLRQIGRETGLQISGTGGSDPVFGTYGPGSLDQVIGDLLEGAPLNILLASQAATPTLSLSPRSGGPITPGAVHRPAAANDDEDEAPPRAVVTPPQRSANPTQPNVNPTQPAADINGTGPYGRGNPGRLPSSPNGVGTPDDIMRRLQQLRQQGNVPTPQQSAPDPQQQGVPVQP